MKIKREEKTNPGYKNRLMIIFNQREEAEALFQHGINPNVTQKIKIKGELTTLSDIKIAYLLLEIGKQL